ncbi:MAG: type II toxin-antitoxin system VapB family antitoxin [Candidatus Marithrix sp.]
MITPTHLVIDENLISEALKISEFKTQKETINTALQEFINRRKQLEITELFGKFDPDSDYDYKKGRNF